MAETGFGDSWFKYVVMNPPSKELTSGASYPEDHLQALI
jgi:hypothetical protein